MDKITPNFFLGSSDSNIIIQPLACWVRGRIAGPSRSDGMWVKVDPPLTGQRYGLGNKDIFDLILFSRSDGTTLFPINEWPLHVYVYRPLNEEIFRLGKFASGQAEMIVWGELYRTFEEAKVTIPKE